MTLRLVIFDVDGTLIDSQGMIVTCMAQAFATEGLPAPGRTDVLSIVGLSLPQAFAQLAPDQPVSVQERLTRAYKTAFADLRQSAAAQAPFYPGAEQAIQALHAHDDVLLAIATGKSRRGLDIMLEAHSMAHLFVSTQVADDHPSKPHPSMLLTALAETGVDAANAVMIGDTTFDMQMADAAQVPFIGVDWGYHPADSLHSALTVLSQFDQLEPLLSDRWSLPA